MLVVFHREWRASDRLPQRAAEGGVATAIDLSQQAAPVEPAWHEALRGALAFLDVGAHAEEAASRVREKLVAFVAEWPNLPLGGRTFMERFRTDSDLPLWWLTALSEKNNEDRPTFQLLCDLEVVRLVLRSQPDIAFGEAVIVTDNRDFYVVCRRLLEAHGISVAGSGPRRLFDPEGVIPLLAQRLRLFLSQMARTVACRLLAPLRGDTAVGPHPVIAFHTWYPLQWTTRGGERMDRYYTDLPAYLGRRGGLGVVYAATFLGLPFREHFRLLRRFGRRHDAAGEFRDFELVDQYLRVGDVLRAHRGSMTLRYLWMERFDRRLRASFAWDGVSVFELLRKDLRVSFLVRIPELLLSATQTERFARVRQPTCLVTYLELYCYGRAVIHGAKRGHPPVTTIGYQHSTITRNKLFYRFAPGELLGMPAPDRFVVTGPFARDVLVSSGYANDCLWLIGSPRFSGLARPASVDRPREDTRSALRIPTGRTAVLVTGNIFRGDTDRLLRETVLALRSRPDCFAIFKLHPFNRRHAERTIGALAREHRYETWTIADMDVQALLTGADVLISSNSTTIGEAIAAGVPVINLRIGYLDLSPAAALEDAAWEAWDASGLSRAVDEIVRREGRFNRVMAARQTFVEGMFFRLDGRANERFEAHLGEELGQERFEALAADAC